MKKLTFHRKTAGLYQNFTVQEMLWHTCHRTLVLPMRMPLLYILPYSFSLPFPPCFMLLHLPLSHMQLHWKVTSPYTLPASLSASSWLIHYLRSHYTMRDLIQGYFYCQCLRWSWRKIRTCLHHWTMCIRKQPHSPWRQCWSQNLRRIKTEESTREWWRILWSMESKTRNIRHTLRIFPFEYRISFWDFFSKLHTINSFLLWALKIIIIKSQSFTYVYNSRYVRIKVRKRLL